MDVSNAVDALFGCVVPERLKEVSGFWVDADQVRLLEAPRFLVFLVVSPGVV